MNVFWDYDGTLMDTYPVMVECLKKLMQDRGCVLDADQLMAWMKDSLSEALRQCSQICGEAPETLLRDFRALEKERFDDVRPCEGIPDLMRAIHERGDRQFLVTHRERDALSMLERYDLARYLTDAVTAENGFPRKPAPDSLRHLMNIWQVEEGVMIGDRPLDVEAGNRAGLESILLDCDDRFPHTPCTFRVRNGSELQDALWRMEHKDD